MNSKTFALKGTVCYSEDLHKLVTAENAWVVCEDGRCAGVFAELPEKYAGIPCRDVGDSLIIPGMSDLHLHAPQYSFRSIGMDLELLEWLDNMAFPEESGYADMEYAKKAYSIFAEDLKKSATTRASVFATLHVPATELLMELLNDTGVKAYVGKVNMDRNGPATLQEESAKASAEATERWILDTLEKYENVKPILTPRFTPSCTDALMEELGRLQKKYHLPVQSHLSENLGEIAWGKRALSQHKILWGSLRYVWPVWRRGLSCHYGTLRTLPGRRDRTDEKAGRVHCALSAVQYESVLRDRAGPPVPG